MTRSRLSALVASALLLGGITMTAASAPVAAAPRTCVHAGSGTADNFWLGGDGDWSDPTHWSLGTPPGPDGREYVCIPDDVAVTLDSGRVDVQAFELGRGASLTLAEGSSLYTWGGAEAESLTRKGSLVVVRGASLGGPGQLHVIGTVQVSNTTDVQARLSGEDGAGLMLVGDDGTLDVSGSDGDVRLTGGYSLDVRGRVRLLGDAGLLADAGTRLALGPHLAGDGGVGRLVIRDDRGYFSSDLTAPSRLVNHGRIVKLGTDGNSAVAAAYSGGGETRVRSGYLVLPDAAVLPTAVAAGASVGSGTCADRRTCVTDTTPAEPQFASMTLPEQAPGFTPVVVTQLTGEAAPGGSVGDPVKVHAVGLVATRADPAVIELRYDRDLLASEDRPFDSDALDVAHSSGGAYTTLPDCVTGGAIPATSFACVDRRAGASREDGDDVIMVVRTTRTSRWIIP